EHDLPVFVRLDPWETSQLQGVSLSDNEAHSPDLDSLRFPFSSGLPVVSNLSPSSIMILGGLQKILIQ
ncbi:unnamed protein product, partial [Musa acuminata subsp. burmannicoides]